MQQNGTLRFTANVVAGTPAIGKGNYGGELSSTGLVLKKGSECVAQFAVVSSAKKLPRNRIQIETPQGPVILQVIKLNGYVDEIVDAVVLTLSGERTNLTPSNYQVPTLLLGVALLPLVLLPIGGLIGGALGGASAGINIQLARKKSWAVVIRVMAMLGSFAIAAIAFVSISFALLGSSNKTGNTGKLPRSEISSPPTAPSIPKAETKPPAPIHETLREYEKNGVVRISVESSVATYAHRTLESNGLLVGHRDGSLKRYSFSAPEQGWKTVAKTPGAVTRLDVLTSDYFIVRCSDENFLLTPQGKLLRFPWKWICLPSSTMLFAVAPDRMLIGMLNFGTIERAAINSTNGLNDSFIGEFPVDALESKDGPPLIVEPPVDFDVEAISTVGATPIALGFENGRIAFRVSSEWITERPRSKRVTCFGEESGIGFEDGIIDTGLVDDELRFRKCGDQPIVRISSIQVWTIVLNSKGEAWSFVRQSKDEPVQILKEESIGPIKSVIPLDSAIAIVGEEKVAFQRRLTEL